MCLSRGLARLLDRIYPSARRETEARLASIRALLPPGCERSLAELVRAAGRYAAVTMYSPSDVLSHVEGWLMDGFTLDEITAMLNRRGRIRQ